MQKIIFFLTLFFCAQTCLAAAKIGDKAQFKIQTFGGKEFNLKQHRQKIVIINFWASWCSACRKEILALQKIKQDYGQGIEIIGVALDKNAKNLAKNLNYENGAIENMVSNIDEPESIPAPYFIDKNGKIVAIFDDENIAVTEEILREKILEIGEKTLK